MPHAVSQEQTPITQPFYAARLSDNALAKKARFVWTPYHESVDATGNFSLRHASSAGFAVDKWTARSYTQSGFSNTGSTITRISPYSVPGATAFTVYILGQLGSITANGGLWGTGGDNYISVTTAGAFQLFLSSGVRLTSSNTINTGESFEVLAYGNNSAYNILLNNTLTTASGGFNTLIDPTFLAFGSAFRSLTCRMYVAAYWPEILNDAQQVELRRNPWQLFEPEPIHIYWQSASGAFKPAWAGSRSGVLGAGVH